MGLIGDSGVTGAVTDPELQPNFSSLKAQLLGPLKPSTALTPVRIFYSQSEADDFFVLGKTWLDLQSSIAVRLDRTDNSFGALVAWKRLVDSKNVLLVGQDSAVVSSIPKQFKRLYELGATHLPQNILISFTANDFCMEKIYSQSPEKVKADFAAKLARAWRDSIPFLKAHPDGTRITVLAPFDVVNVLNNPSVLSRNVKLEGMGEVTCGQLRRQEISPNARAWLFHRMVQRMCPSVTTTRPDDKTRINHIKMIQDRINEAWKTQIANLTQSYARTSLSWIPL